MDLQNKRKLMKKTLKNIVLLGALCGGSLHATFEFRTPLSLEDRGYMHWLLAPADQAWWYGQMPNEKTHTGWNIHIWGAAYSRTADKAFFDCTDADKVTRDTTTLSQLWFGKTVFRGENAFAGGTFAGAPNATQVLVNGVNPYLSFARIMPKFDYNETGCNMGIDFARYVGNDDRFHIGGRANIPFKIIEIEQDSAYTLEETLDDVFVTRVINTDEAAAPIQIDYAMRFDFLNTLVFNQTTQPSGTVTPQPVVRYNANGSITVTGQPLTGATSDIPAAYATKSADGEVPEFPFRRTPSQAGTALGANGEGIDGQVYFFQNGVDYAGNIRNNRDAQAEVFITPRSNADGVITLASDNIRNNIQFLIDNSLIVSEPASSFFLDNGINLAEYERIVGVGDLSTEIYGGIGHYNDWFVDGIFGVQFPTGKRQPTSNRIFYKPTGNNGHVEIKLELDGGWQPCRWFAFEIRPAFFHAVKRSEKRAAPFEGATITNIGPEIDMNVSWNYFVLRTDFSFFHPHNPDLGLVLGYELFAKGKDNVSLGSCFPCDDQTVTDLLGRTNQTLDVSNYECGTNSLANKLRGQIFYRCNYFEIFGGGTHIVSGRHVMKETEGHLGLMIYF